MRSFEERRAEVFLRGKKGIEKRRRAIKYRSLCAMLLVLCMTVSVGGITIAAKLGKNSADFVGGIGNGMPGISDTGLQTDRETGVNCTDFPSTGGIDDPAPGPDSGPNISDAFGRPEVFRYFKGIKDLNEAEKNELATLFFPGSEKVIVARDSLTLSRVTDITDLDLSPDDRYTEGFFEKKTLVIVYFVSPGLNDRYYLDNFRIEGGTLFIEINRMDKLTQLTSARSRLLFIEVPSDELTDIEQIVIEGFVAGL